MRLRRVGYAPETLTVAAFETIRSAAGSVAFHRAGEIAARLRAVKSPWEIRRIRRAVRCAEEAFESVRGRIRPGMTEADLRLDLEWEMRRRGAEDAAFETIVAAGTNASRPHAHAGGRKLRPGGLVLVDWGARLGGYASDLTRVLFLGSIPPLWRRRYEHLLAAQRAGIDAIAPGVAARAADAAARERLAGEGLAKWFAHGLGHGLGLAVHEGPRLSPRDERTLWPGNVVTVEPGLYFPGKGGLRLEDDVLVTKTGRSVLSRLPRDLEWAVVG
jgi:Xaa-Pro aminopeptidase